MQSRPQNRKDKVTVYFCEVPCSNLKNVNPTLRFKALQSSTRRVTQDATWRFRSTSYRLEILMNKKKIPDLLDFHTSQHVIWWMKLNDTAPLIPSFKYYFVILLVESIPLAVSTLWRSQCVFFAGSVVRRLCQVTSEKRLGRICIAFWWR